MGKYNQLVGNQTSSQYQWKTYENIK